MRRVRQLPSRSELSATWRSERPHRRDPRPRSSATGWTPISHEIGQTMLRTSPLADLLRGARFRDRDLRPRTAAGGADRLYPGADGRDCRTRCGRIAETLRGQHRRGRRLHPQRPVPRQQPSAGHHRSLKPVFDGRADRLLGRGQGPSRRRRRRRRRRLQPGRASDLGGVHPDPAGEALRAAASPTRRCGTRSCSTSTCRSWSRATCTARSARCNIGERSLKAAGQVWPRRRSTARSARSSTPPRRRCARRSAACPTGRYSAERHIDHDGIGKAHDRGARRDRGRGRRAHLRLLRAATRSARAT